MTGHADYLLARTRAADEGEAAPVGTPCPYPDGSPEARSWVRAHVAAHMDPPRAGGR